MKQKIQLESSLNAVSGPILWNAISTPTGLQGWMAEKVDLNDQTFTFEWSKEEIRHAEVLQRRTNSHIRLHWTDDEDPKGFFELRMEYNELTGDYSLIITDFVDEDEAEEMTDLWDFEVQALLRQCGM